MKSKKSFYIIITFIFMLTACNDVLDIQPKDRVTPKLLFSTEDGLKTVLATLYNRIPMEDFNYAPNFAINITGIYYGDGGWQLASHTDDMVLMSNAGGDIGRINDNYWDYQGIRYVNGFFDNLEELKGSIIDEGMYKRLKSEAHFIRAFMYFALVKRYGGVPIITKVQTLGDNLFVPRNTEKETWDFVLSECDLAVQNLPESIIAEDGIYRATKWAALALKSRAALFAASVAKYWNRAPLTGEAVNKKLVGGMSSEDANNYYQQCINASKALIENSNKQLYKPNPATSEEAIQNFQALFENPNVADIEVIFKRGYIDGSNSGQQGHATDYWGYPQQLKPAGAYMCGRFGPTLDLVNAFEDYSNDGDGNPGELITRNDGIENYYEQEPRNLDVNIPFKHYDNQFDIFGNKDARLMASIILPGSVFKNELINCQGGLIRQDGTTLILSRGSAVGKDGKTYYSYGTDEETGFSAFGSMGSSHSANSSSTGFCMKKFLQEKTTPQPSTSGSTQDWIEFRIGEIYLNYAEAIVESGQGDVSLAKKYLNALRKRAAHADEIPATIDNIRKERRVELAFENHRYWDLIRWREMHTLLNVYKRKSLIPILDLRQNPPKYIFLRAYNYYDQLAGGKTFHEKGYYVNIPGVASNNLIQNPSY